VPEPLQGASTSTPSKSSAPGGWAHIPEARARGAGAEFIQRGAADVVGHDGAGGSEKARELQGFSAGPSAGVEPAASRTEAEGFEQELRA